MSVDAPDFERLRSIKTLPQLIAYLRDELGWPIDGEDLDDVTFDYDPSELGFDKDAAAKIKEIKQFRPVETGQPWGIFWINFEKKNLPVVILRRILANLAIQKRPSARRADRPAWKPNDLLFISAYGEESDRAVTFAHFSEDLEASANLPVLKVLGWDDADTVLHIADAHHQLTRKLRWPADPNDVKSWRSEWSDAFTIKHREIITSTQELVKELAELAKRIRKRANSVLDRETTRGPMRRLYKAFQETLIHDLKEDDFADVIAQTVSYGLLVARFSRSGTISAQNLVDMIPPTNPFLRELLSMFLTVTGRKKHFDFDELGIQEVIDLLNDVHSDAVKADFGDRTRGEDPVIHFYEHFLAAYDKKKKVKRGVFFTPQPVVSYIVRSVHELLQSEFGIKDGLASTITWGKMASQNPDLKIPGTTSKEDYFVVVLDPAVGTATFLVEVIEVIFTYLKKSWDKKGVEAMPRIKGKKATKKWSDFAEYWNSYVRTALLPRLYGYELMVAPYIIAHMKLELKLSEVNARLGQDVVRQDYGDRAQIYLTNSLEPAGGDKQGALEGIFPALAHEATAVNRVKRGKRFTLVIGNPPYAGHSSNTGDWITQLVDDYYTVDGMPLGERNPKWLQDDYVKFIRLGQHLLTQTGCGIQGYITNHGYVDNPTFRGMRQQLMAAFSAIDLLDLHGNTTKKEVSPDGSEDVNVFDIKQGVAILAARRQHAQRASSCAVQHAEIFGSQKKKYDQLAAASFSCLPLNPVHPTSPFYLFVPQDSDLEGEYAGFQKMTDAMPVNVLGFQTHRDEIAVGFDADNLLRQVKNYLGGPPQKRDWDRLQSPCTYRLFDVRAVYLHTDVCDRPRRELLDHVVHQENISLGLGRQGIAVQDPIWSLVTASRLPTDANIFRRGGINIFPLYLYPEADGLAFDSERLPNLSGAFLDTVAVALSLPQKATGGIPRGLAPEDILHYAYAVFHSPTYRTRYAEFLKIDFPRLPLTSSLDLFRSLAKLGGELVALHLMESPDLDKHITQWVGGKNPEVEKISYSDETVWIDKAKSKGFQGVPENVWIFHIGGYQVCEKWLKDRGPKKGKPGRILSDEDINHYQKIVVAINETIRIMKEIDEVIDQHGGWPEAFITGK